MCLCDSWLQELGILTPVLETDNYAFALELAVTAASNGALDLEQWLPALFHKTSDPFVTCLASYLHRKYDAATATHLSQQSAELLVKVRLIFPSSSQRFAQWASIVLCCS